MTKIRKRKAKKPDKQFYAIGIGSNRAVSRHLPPRRLLSAALHMLDRKGVRVKAVAPMIVTRPVGPSVRDFVNSVAIIRTRLPPPSLLDRLHEIEHRFGRLRRGRWGARTLDLDILLWEGGVYRSPSLIIPHPAIAERDFVLRPLCAVAPDWRDPLSGLRMTHLRSRFTRPKPVDPTGPSR